ncbi:MAG: hypothetical protein II112_04930, partial [Bacteroidales bacterium]|nr:hypothetical protein [Bacteroidales bacterium]
RYVDANIFLLRAGVCELKFVDDLDEAARTKHLKNVYIVLNGVDTLDVLPAGAIPPNPSELIESQKMAQTVDLLKSLDYDYIFFDSSPYLPVADATTFNRYVDANIFMLRAGVCDLKFVEDLDEAAANGNLKNVYIVLNGVDIKARSYGYHYGYGYGHYGYGKNKYGYGYGYGYGDKKKVGQTESAASETK